MRRQQKQRGFSLIELLIVVAVILVIAAIAIPSLIKAKAASNETSAAATLKSVYSGLVGYSEQCSSTGFPAALTNAGPGDGTCTGGTNHLDSVMGTATPTKSGYGYTYTPGAPAADGHVYSLNLAADPLSSRTGTKHFLITEDGIVHYNLTAPAAVTDPALGK